MTDLFAGQPADRPTRKAPRKRVHTPTILQMEAVECGAASLAMILAYHGRWVPLEQLRQSCGVSRNGAKALNVVRGARDYGMESAGFKKEIHELYDLKLPFVVFWNFNHFLVVEGFGGGQVHLNDPALGRRSVSDAEFSKSYTGVALTFQPTKEFKKGGVRPRLWRSLGQRLRGQEGALGFVVLISLLLVIPGIVIPAFTKIFIDEYIVANQDEWVRPLLLAYVIALAISLTLTWMQQRYLLRMEIKLSLTSSARMLWHLLCLPVDYFTQRYAGDLSSRVAANNRVASLLSSGLATNMVAIVSLVFYAMIMVSYDLELALIAISLSLINLLAMRMVWKRRENASKLLAQSQGKLLATAMGGLLTIETLKASGSENDYFARWGGFQAQYVSVSQAIGKYSQLVSALPGLLAGLANVAILGLGSLKVMEGQLTVGDMIAFQALLSSFNGPIKKLVDLGARLQQAEADMNRIDDVLNYPMPVPAGPPLLTVTTRPKLTGRLELKGVTFGYSRLEPPLIEGFDLTLEPGARVALVGLTGSGKSTAIKLVSGLYKPWAGDILLDGVPIERIDPLVLRNSVAVVDQEVFLFNASIRDNITMWDNSVPDGVVVDAARDAAAHDLIMARPDGYAALVQESGRNFSGGERQRLEIARALAVQPTILLMDEATAALDPITEKIIDDNVRRRGATCLIVAHRLSTIRDADEIIVLRRGKVIQRGTHDELKAQEGEYARLIAAQ